MQFLRNRRSARTLALVLGAGTGLLILGPGRLLAQDTTSNIPKTHTVVKGDNLWNLAGKYLNDPFRWPEIYRLNTDIIQDPHWIYPGEILKLPGYVATELPPAGAAVNVPTPGVVPPTAPPVDTTQRAFRPNQPSLFAKTVTPVVPAAPVGAPVTPVPVAPDTAPPSPVAAASAVRYGDFLRAPWIERREGPLVWGRIIGSAEIPGIDPARQRARFQMNDRVLIAPPTGSVAPEHELYLAYHYGPLLENVGQVIIPTGVLEVLREPVNGDAAVARVVRMFGEVQERDRLMPYDSSAVAATGVPTPIKNGMVGDIRMILDEPVLPPLENYLLLTFTSRDGMKIGDQLELFKPREKAIDAGQPSIPEIHIGTAQVVRVTPLGTTAMITALEQPKVDKGTRVRVVAKMQ